MLAKERQDKINAILKKNGAVMTSDLVERFQVSVETVRRDLLLMEQKGILSRVHGGAVIVGEMEAFHDLDYRNQKYSVQKRELVATAASFVREGDYIGIDSGSTAILFAEALKDRYHNLTIVTHSMDVFEHLRDSRDFKIILCGGFYLREERAFYGSPTLDMLGGLHLQKAFIFPSAISLEFGICDFQPELFQVQKKMKSVSDSIFIAADSSKFEKKALLKLDDMRQEYTYITDSNLPSELKKIYAENDRNVYNGTDSHHSKSTMAH